jgi:hypothetical protein
LVVLCSACDYGNIYCFDGCAEQQRKCSLRRANKNYRNTFKGKRKASERQARFRQRVRERSVSAPPDREKVTHQGSERDIPPAPMVASPKAGAKVMNRCHCCGKAVDDYLRRGFIRHSIARLSGSFPVPLSD